MAVSLKSKLERELVAFLQLPDGWGGYFGKKFNVQTVNSSISVLRIAVETLAFWEVNNYHIQVDPRPNAAINIGFDYQDRQLIFNIHAKQQKTMTVNLVRNNKSVQHRLSLTSKNIRECVHWLVFGEHLFKTKFGT